MVPCPGMHIKGARPGVTQTNTKTHLNIVVHLWASKQFQQMKNNQMRMLLDTSLKPSLRGPRNSRHYEMNTASEKLEGRNMGRGSRYPLKHKGAKSRN